MKSALKIIIWGAGIAVLGFIAVLISYGGSRSVTLQQTIDSAPTMIPEDILSFNLTDALTDKLTEKIVEKNPAGPLNPDGETTIVLPAQDELINQTLQEQLANFDPSSLRPIVSENSLTTAETSSDTDRIDYFLSLRKIIAKNMTTDSPITQFPQPTELLLISKKYKNTMAELSALKIPKDLIDIHIQSLELFGTQANAFELLAGYEEDPLKAMLAVEIQKSIAQEASELHEKMLSYIQEHSLKF